MFPGDNASWCKRDILHSLVSAADLKLNCMYDGHTAPSRYKRDEHKLIQSFIHSFIHSFIRALRRFKQPEEYKIPKHALFMHYSHAENSLSEARGLSKRTITECVVRNHLIVDCGMC